RNNVEQNGASVECSLLPWLPAGRRKYARKDQYDVVLFADGIYTERGALLLADAATALLRPDGVLVGALPDLRSGMRSFEEDLAVRGLSGTEVVLDQDMIAAASRTYEEDALGLVAGGPAEGYRVMMWRYTEQA
ncbi:unnamed protein product, partial [Effrenium voratum]